MKQKQASVGTLSMVLLLLFICLAILQPGSAQGAESGTGVYLMGYQSSLAGFMPPPGLYARNDFYIYEGNARAIPMSGVIELNLRARYIINLINLTYVSPWKILGGDYAAGIIWGAIANTFVKGRVAVPNLLSQTQENDYTGVSDVVLTPFALGWHLGNFHIIGLGNVFAPTGSYDSDRIANTGLNRWAIQPALAVTYLHPTFGQEVSVNLGYTVNFENAATDYTSGNEFNLEFFLGQHLPRGFALGMAGYFYQQMTPDHGSGARLGSFRGQAFALGPALVYNTTVCGHLVGLNARYYDELSVKNRLDGESFFLTLNVGF